MNRLLLILAVLVPMCASASQPVRLEAHLDRESVKIGQPAEFEIELRHDPDVEIEFPKEPSVGTEALEVQDALVVREGPGHLRYVLRVVGYQPGIHSLQPLQLTYRSQSRSGSVKTPKLQLEVLPEQAGPEDKPDEIRGAKPPVPIRFPEELWLGALGTGLVLTFLTAALFRRLRRRSDLPPYEAALQQLTRLEDALQSQNWPSLYDGTSETVRRYLSWRLGVPLMERTTEEIAAETKPEVGQVLSEADRVKFAGLSPEPAQASEHLARARQLVEAHAPPERSDDQ